MRLIVTGGGTGGHVFPALETATQARERGWDVQFYGAARGQEVGACERAAMPLRVFQTGPVYKPLTPKGARSLISLLRATSAVLKAFDEDRPQAVFATGGYAAAPVMQAARKRRVPLVVHEQNTVPGRTNLLFGRHAYAVCTAFHGTARHFRDANVVRTGMPVRRALRQSAQGRLSLEHGHGSASPVVLVMGGSQGSSALNDMALSTAVRMAKSEVQWLHVTGTSHFDVTNESLQRMAVRSDYKVRAYLDADEMAAALFECSLAWCRSGAGTLAELAAFRKPSLLVPYPHAFGDHQRHNALEFVAMGAAEVVAQGEMNPAQVEARILSWLMDKDRRMQAESALAEWDVPDAVDRIIAIIERAAS